MPAGAERIRELRVLAGEPIERACIDLSEMACRLGRAWMTFNGVVVEAGPNDNATVLEGRWRAEMQRRAEDYRRSRAGVAAAAESAADQARLQARAAELVAALPSLDWSSDVAVLDWLCAMQEPSDRMGVEFDRDRVVKAFYAHDFVSNANTGKAYRADDRDNVYRYLVGQALDGLRSGGGGIHSILHNFVERWKVQFFDPSGNGGRY